MAASLRFDNYGLVSFVKELENELQRLRDDTEIVSLGLSMAETRNFRYITGNLAVQEAVSGSLSIAQFQQISEETYSEETYNEYAAKALNYLSNLVLLAQEVYPNAISNIEIKIPLSEQRLWNE